jgi:hypothetical protein
MHASYLIPIGAGVFVALVLVAARITRRALLALAPEDKARLVDAAAQTSLVWFVLAVLLAGVWLAVVLARPTATLALAPLALALFLLLSGFSFASTYRRYKRLGLPPAFLRALALSRALRLCAAAVLFGTLILYLGRALAT